MTDEQGGAKAIPEALIAKFQITKLLKQGTATEQHAPRSNQKLTTHRPKWTADRPAGDNRRPARHINRRARCFRYRVLGGHPSVPRGHHSCQEPWRQRYLPLVSRVIQWQCPINRQPARPQAEPDLALHSKAHQEVLRPAAPYGHRDA